MNNCPFGQLYFSTRKRLLGVCGLILELADANKTKLSDSFSAKAIESELDCPFLFVVQGEVNAGKSTFLNGLFGQELCPVSALPETARITDYQYGDSIRNSLILPTLQISYRPYEFLRDFLVIDTPGLNMLTPEHTQVIEQVLSAADLIFWVLPVTNPWSASTWNTLSGLEKSIADRSVLIVQQADLVSSADISVILAHVRELAVNRVGHALPLFAVSGNFAYSAKQPHHVDEEAFDKSGYRALEAYLSHLIENSEPRREALQRVYHLADQALSEIETQIDLQKRNFSNQGYLLDSIEGEIDEIRINFITLIQKNARDLATLFEPEALAITQHLNRQLKLFPTLIRLFNGGHLINKLEDGFLANLQAAVSRAAGKDAEEIIQVCRDHWSSVAKRIISAMAIKIEDAAPIESIFSNAKITFIQTLARAANQRTTEISLRTKLDSELAQRDKALRFYTCTCLIFATIGGSFGALGLTFAGVCLFGAAIIIFLLICSLVLKSRLHITDEFQPRILNTCELFARTLQEDYEQAIHLICKDYATSLVAVRNHLAGEKASILPKQTRWNELFRTLRAIKQDL